MRSPLLSRPSTADKVASAGLCSRNSRLTREPRERDARVMNFGTRDVRLPADSGEEAVEKRRLCAAAWSARSPPSSTLRTGEKCSYEKTLPLTGLCCEPGLTAHLARRRKKEETTKAPTTALNSRPRFVSEPPPSSPPPCFFVPPGSRL